MDFIQLQFDADVDRVSEGAAPQPRAAFSDLWAADTNLGAAFAHVARARVDYPAVVLKAPAHSYDQILQAALNVRRYLMSRPGYAAGARVVLRLPNSPEYIAAFYGILLADCVVVPLPHNIETFRWQQVLDSCAPDVVITRAEHLDGATAKTVSLSSAADVDVRPRRGRDDLAVLLFTSGSTGLPKGVMLSHRNLLSNTRSILDDLPIEANDRSLLLIPLCHAFGNSVLQTHLLAGATLVIGGSLTFPSTIVDAMRDFEATSFSAVPEVYGMLLKYGRLGEQVLPRMRYMSVAGGHLRHDLALQVASKIDPAKFFVMYGQSEASPRLASLPPDQLETRVNSIGRPLPGVELAVLDDAGHQLPANEVGTLCARGPNVMLGYWQDDAMTAEVLSKEGWLKTGDLAHRDADGFLYLDGRANLLVKVQGYRVHPGEIESVVEAVFPHARAVAVPVTKSGETRFALFLAPQDHRTIDVAEVRAACLRELPSYKVPVHFEVVEEFPLTSAYKVDRAALTSRVSEA